MFRVWDLLKDFWHYLKYFARAFGMALAVFVVAGMLIHLLAATDPVSASAFARPLGLLGDALFIAVPLASLTGFIIDRNLTLLANCRELGLSAIFRHKRDDGAVRAGKAMLEEARTQARRRQPFDLRIASINGNQLLHEGGDLEEEFTSLLETASQSRGAGRARLLLLNPSSDFAIARAESEEWDGRAPLGETGTSDATWRCRLFADAATSRKAVLALLARFPGVFEVRYTNHLPLHMLALDSSAIVGVHNLAAVKSRSKTWHGNLPIFQFNANTELTTEANRSFEYSWATGFAPEGMGKDVPDQMPNTVRLPLGLKPISAVAAASAAS